MCSGLPSITRYLQSTYGEWSNQCRGGNQGIEKRYDLCDRKKGVKWTKKNVVRIECRNEDRGREAGIEGGDLPSVPQEYGLYRVLAFLRGYVHCHSTVTI